MFQKTGFDVTLTCVVAAFAINFHFKLSVLIMSSGPPNKRLKQLDYFFKTPMRARNISCACKSRICRLFRGQISLNSHCALLVRYVQDVRVMPVM